MVERGVEKRETERKSGILVCNAIHEWSSPASHPDTEYIYVCDLLSGKDYLTQDSIPEVARWLWEGLFGVNLSTAEEKRKVFHNPPIRGFTVWVDGYFGRPFMPDSFYSLHPLEQEQIEDFEEALSKLRKQS